MTESERMMAVEAGKVELRHRLTPRMAVNLLMLDRSARNDAFGALVGFDPDGFECACLIAEVHAAINEHRPISPDERWPK